MKLTKVLILVVILALAGCAMSNLPANPTPEQMAAAECEDAKDAVTAADIALLVIDMSEPARLRWEKKRKAAQLIVNRYCGGK